MSYVFNKSTPATGAEAMFNLKACLKAAGWTVPSSSDGLTYNAAGDQISTSGSGAGGMANNNAWFRVRDPAGVAEFVIQRGGTNLVWRVKWSQTAKFTGGSPTATRTPSATDESYILPGGTDASPTFTAVFDADSSPVVRWNVGADNAAPYGWWAGSFPTGGGTPRAALVYEPLTATEPTDASTHLFYFCSAAGGGSVFGADGAVGSMSTSAFSTSNNAIYGYAPSATTGVFTTYPAQVFAVDGSTRTIPNNMATNPISTKDEVFPIPFLRHAALTSPGWKGVSAQMKWTGTTRTTGDTLTVSTARDRIVYNCVSLPWDGTVPAV